VYPKLGSVAVRLVPDGPREGEKVMCDVTATDGVDIDVTWLLHDASAAVSPETTLHQDDTLPAGLTVAGDRWTCVVAAKVPGTDQSSLHQASSLVLTPLDLDMIQLPAGTFWMGMGETERELVGSSWRAAYEARLTRGFELGVSELTVGDVRRLVPDTAASLSVSGNDAMPVTSLTWLEKAELLDAMSVSASLTPCYGCTRESGSLSCLDVNAYDCVGYRMPTDAEWTYAARYGNDPLSNFPVGGVVVQDGQLLRSFGEYGHCDLVEVPGLPEPLGAYGNICSDGVLPTRRFLPSGPGFYDLMGNVVETIHDLAPEHDWQPGGTVVDPHQEGRFTSTGIRYRQSKGAEWAARYPSNWFISNAWGGGDGAFVGLRVARTLRRAPPSAQKEPWE
jgi:formylglycine-generating enzyme required for sulfatase activity